MSHSQRSNRADVHLRRVAGLLPLWAAMGLLQSGCGPTGGPTTPSEESLSTASVTTSYDLAQYVIPSCASAQGYVTSGTGMRRYVPMGVDSSGRGKYVYVTSGDGAAFLEFTIDASYVRLWTDASWAHNDHPPAPACGNQPYCDEVCGTNRVATSTCRCLWYHGAGSADYVFNAPRDAASSDLGARFLPRTVSLVDENETQIPLGYSVTRAQRKSNCTGCDSWHSSPPGTSQLTTIAIKHMASYNGYTDVIRVRGVDGPGAGELFYYARGPGWVGFENAGYSDWITGGTSSTPWPSLSCKNYVQGSICSATQGGEMSTQRLDVRYPVSAGIWVTQCIPNLSGRYVWQTTSSGKDAYSRWAPFQWPEQINSPCGNLNNGLYPLVFTSLSAGSIPGTWVTQCLPSGGRQHVFRMDTTVNGHPAAVYLYDEPNSACP